MATATQDNLDFASDPPKVSSTLNVLTILTFIGCGLGAIMTLAMPALNSFFLDMMDKAVSSGKDLSARELADIEKGRAAIELYKQNMIPLMVISLVGIVLCFVGALWMRKLKKYGYWLYVAGEILPVIATTVLLGTAPWASGGWNSLVSLAIPVIFVILYTTQRKYLVFK